MESSNPFAYKVSVDVPWERIDVLRTHLVGGTIQDTTTVSGFRRGKAPPEVLKRYYDREIERALVKEFVPDFLSEEISRRDVRVASGPVIDSVRYVEGQPLHIEATYELFPAFELGEYRGLTVEAERFEVTEQTVDKQLEQLRDLHASYRNVDPRPLRDGDFALLSITAVTEDGQSIADRQERQVKIGGEHSDRAESDALRGLGPGEQADYEVIFPGQPGVSLPAGTVLKVHAEVVAVQEAELPDLDDEFAKDLSKAGTEYESLDQVREVIRETEERRAQDRTERALRQSIMRQLADAHPMELPPTFLRQAIERREDAGNHDADRYAEFGGSFQAYFESQVRAQLVLDRIADVEGISVSREELEQFVREAASIQEVPFEAAWKEMAENGQLSGWSANTRRDKALRFVLDEAVRVESEGSEPAQDAADEDPAILEEQRA